MRPAVVVSNDRINGPSPVVVVAAMTRTIPSKNYPQNVHLAAGQPLRDAGTILASQLMTVDKTRLVKHRGTLTGLQIASLDSALKASLDL